jgi:hypothetical protein
MPDGAEQADEGGRGADGGQPAQAAFHLRGGQGRGPLDGQADRFHGIMPGLLLLLEQELLQAGRQDLGKMALVVSPGRLDRRSVVPLSQGLRRERQVFDRLLLGLAVKHEPFDEDADRVDRHQKHRKGDSFRQEPHLVPNIEYPVPHHKRSPPSFTSCPNPYHCLIAERNRRPR